MRGGLMNDTMEELVASIKELNENILKLSELLTRDSEPCQEHEWVRVLREDSEMN